MNNATKVRQRWVLDPDKVTERRLELGLKQITLADSCDISPQLMNDIEAGRRAGSPPVRARLAKALGVTLRDLCKDES